MNWLNLNVATLDSETFLGSEPLDRATWLCLLRYCIGQENGGVIDGAESWGDRKWQQLVRVTKKEVSRATGLWSWGEGNLIVWEYPLEKEDEVRNRRERARTNGAKGGRPKGTDNETQKEPTSDSFAKAEGERKEKEKGKERNTPLPPEGDGPRVMPENWGRMNKTKQGKTKVLANNKLMIRIGAWFGRSADTLWTVAEAAALIELKPTKAEVEGMEIYYTANLPEEKDTRRRSLYTLLNQWNLTELDRARAYINSQL